MGQAESTFWNLNLVLVAALLVAACQPGAAGRPAALASAVAAPAAAPTPSPEIPAPRYSDALTGLFNKPASSVPLDVAVNYYAPHPSSGGAARAVLTMALVPGANYGRLRQYHQQAVEAATTPNARALAQDDLQTQPVLQKAVEIVKERYPWLELMDDVATAQERNVSLTLVMDIRSRLGSQAGAPTSVEIEVVVFDERRQPVSRILATGQSSPGSPGDYGFQRAAGAALEELADKSKAYFN